MTPGPFFARVDSTVQFSAQCHRSINLICIDSTAGGKISAWRFPHLNLKEPCYVDSSCVDSTGGGDYLSGEEIVHSGRRQRAIVVDLGILRSSISELTGALVLSHIVTVSPLPPFSFGGPMLSLMTKTWVPDTDETRCRAARPLRW